MEKDIRKILGNNIKLFRKHLNYTMVEMAKSVPISQSYLSQIENGKKDTTIATLGNIIDFFIITSEFSYNLVVNILFDDSEVTDFSEKLEIARKTLERKQKERMNKPQDSNTKRKEP